MRTLLLKSTSLLVILTMIFNILPLNGFASTTQSVEANTQTPTQNYTELPTESIVSDSSLQMTDAFILHENEDKRSEFSKDFTLNNGLSLAAVYPYAVHFEEGGQWKEIDHTLITATQRGTAVYKNKAGAWNVYFPQTLTSQNSVSVSKDGYTLSFGMAGELRASNVPTVPGGAVVASIAENAPAETYALSAAQSSVAQIQETNIQSVKQGAEHPETVCDKASSRLLYANVYGNTSIIYDLLGNQIKESIVIRSYDADLRGYRYALNTGSLIPELQDDGSIIMYAPDRQTIVFTMPAPYMVDSSGEYSGEVNITLSGGDGTYTLTYVLPTAWLVEEDRAWPVILDPIVNAVSSVSNIADRTVAEERTLAPSWGMNACGYRDGWGIHRFYMKFINLPELEIADIIVHADVSIYDQYDPDSFSVVEVHEVFSTWTSTGMTWENAPTFSDAVTDYIHVTAAGEYTFDITELACKWYSGLNTGMVFKMSDEVEQSAVEDWKQFYSCEFGVVRPTMRIFYRNSNGLESYWDYTTSSAGRAGTGYVNNITGNLTWVHNNIGFGGNRMPVSISHIYNANDSASNAFGMGYGWRTNFNQIVTQINDSNVEADYVWQDGDGTKHYFVSASNGTYVDEDGLGLTLTVSGSTIRITDKLDNSSVFSDGRLTYIYNNQNPTDGRSAITIEYDSSNHISCVKDGINRAYNFTYTNGLLTRISYTGTGSEEISFVSFGYEGQKLVSITHKDTKTVTYAYNEGIVINSDHENAGYLSGFNFLTSATDIDGYKIQYVYMIGNSPRVLRIEEKDISDNSTAYQLGSTLTFAYGYNQTKITDHNGNFQLLQFNDWGNLVSVQDSLGRAQLAQYAFTEHDDTSSDTTAKANQLREVTKMLSTATNLLPNSSFEGNTVWSGGVIANVGYIGSKSMLLNTSCAANYTTGFTVKPGETITFSAYVKTSSTNTVYLSLISGNTALSSSDAISSSSAFTRLQVSYTNTGSTSVTVKPKAVNGAGGTAYVDCVQLEYMSTASRYNLLSDGIFNADGAWNDDICASGDETINIETILDDDNTAMKAALPILDPNVFRMTGDPLSEKYISQIIKINGKAGDEFILTGWAMADAVPLSGERKFGLKLIFKNGTTVVGEAYEEFNTAISGKDWQFTACYASASADYDSIIVQVLYSYAANVAYFDGIQLVKERFGSTYTYNEGNVETATNEEGNTTQYTYENNDLKTVVEPGNKTTTYTYDNFHNVLTATTPQGVVYSYTYDKYGNNTSVSVGSGTTKMTSSAAYSEDGNILRHTTDTLGRKTLYGYNVDTNVLDWVQYPKDSSTSKTQYLYDDMYRLGLSYKTLLDGTMQMVVPVYTDDYLTRIGTMTTGYSFTYGTFGLRNTVSAGERLLAAYEYDEQDHAVTKLKYGNEDSVTYTYDTYGRVIQETYEDGSTIAYAYDNDGALATVTDSESGVKTTYYYDFSNRLVQYVESGTNHSHSVKYDYSTTTGNISGVVETINGIQHATSYTHDRDDYIVSSSIGNVSGGMIGISYGYDTYRRVTGISYQYIGYNYSLSRQYGYTSTASSSPSTQIASYTVDTPSIDVQYSYTYDSNGNILTISDGTKTISYQYDTANQLLRENNPYANRTWVWTYDAAGNITSRKEYAYTTDTVVGTVEDEIMYLYEDEKSWGDLLTSYDGTAITYDNIGNPLSDGTRTYTWKQGRQLATLAIGGTTWSFTYDANGMRTKRTNGTKTYSYVYSDGLLKQMNVDGYTLEFFYDAGGTPIAMTVNNVLYYYVTNLQGDVVHILSSTGAALVTYTYDAWGKPLSTTDSTATTDGLNLGELNPLRYRSYVYDQELGLYYLQSRYYNPTWGRFINADALVSTGQGILGNNMFAYCRNNPVKRKDISGTNDLCVVSGDDDNPLDDLGYPSGGGGGGYVYGVSFSTAQYSSLYTGGIYNNGYSSYGYSTGSATPGQGSNTTPSACFVAGTLVQSEDGVVPIEDIKVGDLVWAWDEETGNVALKKVVETYLNQSDELIHIFVNGEAIVTTPTHPFYSPVKGWTAACKLRAGDILVTVNGEYVVVEKIQHEILEAPITVYNFQVEGYHTYYVSNSGVLVHNSCPKGPDKKQAKEIAKSLGYSKVQGVFSHGQAIFRNSDAIKTLRFISVDVDSHNGGFWKAASSIDNLRHKSTRSGTYTWDLTERIGD